MLPLRLLLLVPVVAMEEAGVGEAEGARAGRRSTTSTLMLSVEPRR